MGITVPFEVKDSGIHGKGVFATQPIKAGTTVWKFDLETCKMMTVKEFKERLENPECTEAERYDLCWHGFGYLDDAVKGHLWLIPVDGNENTNHSLTPNLTWPTDINCLEDERSIAGRDIEAGEELVEDYTLYGITDEIIDILMKHCPERAQFEVNCRKAKQAAAEAAAQNA